MKPSAAWLLAAAIATATLLAGAPARADDVTHAGADDVTPTRHLTVEMTEYRFIPNRIELEAGVEAHLTLVNRGKVMHEFEAPYLADVQVNVESEGLMAATLGLAEVEVPPGGSATLVFTPEKPGEFPFECGARMPMPHQKLGMRGTLVVR